MDVSHNDIEIKKYLRKKEEILREKEEELKMEENKLQEVWMNVPEGKEMIPVIQFEIFEYRKLRKEVYLKIEGVEREKNEWRERFRTLEQKERDLKENEWKLRDQVAEFKQNKAKIVEKLEWLKKKLMQNECN
jgi:chromosome segregation ATPase